MKTYLLGTAVLIAALLPLFASAATTTHTSATVNTEDAHSQYALACQPDGTKKLDTQADAYGVKLDPASQTVCGLDARFYNPSKYIWYCAEGVDANGTDQQVTVLVQYYLGQCI